MNQDKPKIRIVACADNFTFIKPLIPALSEWYDIKQIYSGGDAGDDFDLIWLEWADGVSIALLYQLLLVPQKKVVLRLHRYELFSPRTFQALSNLQPKHTDNIDKLVFVSAFVKELGISKFPWMADSVVIPNLIDHTKFPLFEKRRGCNILMLGRMSYVKNLPLALTVFKELVKIHDSIDMHLDYKLHIVGEISDPELIYYCANFIQKANLGAYVQFHGRIPNEQLPMLLREMHYVLCTSIFESQGMGILEAMACGLKPLIFNFPGAETLFPSKWLWTDVDDFLRIIFDSQYDPKEYSDYVYENFSIERKIHLYRGLIEGVLNGTFANRKKNNTTEGDQFSTSQ